MYRVYGELVSDHKKEIEKKFEEMKKKHGVGDYQAVTIEVCREHWLNTPLMQRTIRDSTS